MSDELKEAMEAPVTGRCEACGDWVTIEGYVGGQGWHTGTAAVSDGHGGADPEPFQCGPVTMLGVSEEHHATLKDEVERLTEESQRLKQSVKSHSKTLHFYADELVKLGMVPPRLSMQKAHGRLRTAFLHKCCDFGDFKIRSAEREKVLTDAIQKAIADLATEDGICIGEIVIELESTLNGGEP